MGTHMLIEDLSPLEKEILLNEGFPWPLGLERYNTKCEEDIGGPVRSNISLEDKLIEIISSEINISKTAYKAFEDLVRNRYITLGTTNKAVSFFIRKILELPLFRLMDFLDIFKSQEKHVAGFFCPLDKKLFILLFRNTGLLGLIDEKSVVRVFVHELAHAFNSVNNKIFESFFINHITHFYSNFLKIAYAHFDENYHNIDKIKNGIKILAKYLLKFERNISNIETPLMAWKTKIIEKTTSNNQNANDIFLSMISNTLFLIGKDLEEITRKMGGSLYPEDYMFLCNKFYKIAYVKTFPGMKHEDMNEFNGQEIIFPSEIISVYLSHSFENKPEIIEKILITYFINVKKNFSKKEG